MVLLLYTREKRGNSGKIHNLYKKEKVYIIRNYDLPGPTKY